MEVKGRRIQASLSPRDSTFQAEHLWISLDTYHDKRTSYSYGVSASGVRMDFFNKSDNEMDLDEDYSPVWQAKAARSETNWSAEFRIPFSQLRFTIGNNDFRKLSFRSNVVLRWEYRPGSTLYVVWQKDRADPAACARAGFSDLVDSISAKGDSIFAMKSSFFWGRK